MIKANSISKLLTAENITKGLAYGFYYLKHRIKKIPIGVNYDLTWNCNLRCKHCYFNSSIEELSNSSVKNRIELTDDQWLKIFKYHRHLGSKSASLTGGEPTLRMGLLEKAIKIFPSVQIASN